MATGLSGLQGAPEIRIRLAAASPLGLTVAGERLPVPRRVKDFIEISEHTGLDSLIRFLETVRDNLPADCEPELRIRGDEVFGRRLTISYLRDLTADEAERDARYSAEAQPAPDPRIEALRQQLDEVPYDGPGGI